MPHGDLHPKLVIPDGIFLVPDHKPDTALPVFPAHKFRVFLRCLVGHKIVDQAQMAAAFIAAFPKHLVHHFGRYGNLPCIKRRLPFLNGTYLLFLRRQLRQR